jgi:hypothetical protein
MNPEVFSTSKLSEQQLGCVEFVLNSPAYLDVFKPYLLDARETMAAAMLDRSTGRKDQYPDDFLAGSISTIDSLLNFFQHVLDETSLDRVHASMERITPEVEYHMRQQAGKIVPVMGANQDAAPRDYEPDEDY